jgi:hypothetical protein
MGIYTPDCWELLRVTTTDGEVINKVIAGWYGGFAGSNSWKISSGIETVIDRDDHFEMPQSSGSTYILYKESRRMSSLMEMTFIGFQEQMKNADMGTIELLTEIDPLTLNKEK